MNQKNDKEIKDKLEEFDSLVYAYFDGMVDIQQMDVLKQYLREKSYVRRLVDLCRHDQLIYELMSYDEQTLGDIETKVFSEIKDEGSVLKDLIALEQNSPAIEIHSEEKNIEIISEIVEKKQSTGKFIKLYNRMIYIAAVFMVIFIVYANVFPPQLSEEVATVVDQLDVKWDISSAKLKNGERILTNQLPYKVEKGIVKFSYDEGVDVVIEGPAEFTVEKKGITISKGLLYSYVSEVGQGFTVDTPNNRFIDHGTEFGVYVDQNATSELHVYTGAVQYYSGIKGAPKASKTIRANNARRFDADSGQIQNIRVEENFFARDVNSKTGIIWRGQDIDLADIVGGGTGFGGGELESGIDVEDGQWKNKEVLYRQNLSVGWIRYSDNKYNKVPTIDYIDGVFVPYDANGPVQLSSKGHKYSGFHVGSNEHWNNICFGAWHESSHAPKHNLSSEGITYGLDSDTAAITIHSNQGITFDLDAIRKNIPERRISKFTTKVAISESILFFGKEDGVEENPSKVDFWCFVDGELRDKQEGITYRDGLVEVEIVLDDNERYLTLVVTESDDKCSFDWAFLARPVLVVE